MQKKLFVVILVVFISFSFSSCNKTRKKTLNRLLQLETSDYENEKISKERIEELKKGIKEYTDDVERVVKANAEIGIYYRMIALEYIDLEMYQHALDNLKKALEYYPAHSALNFFAGLSVANIARTEMKDTKRLSLFNEAESYYLASIRTNKNYANPIYALSVLYMFDLDRPNEAAPLLEDLISRDPKNWEAKILYARSKVISGEIDIAIELYDEVSTDAWDDELKEQAARNRDLLLGINHDS